MKIEKKKVAGSDQEYIVFKNTYNEKVTLVAQGDSLRCAIREDGDTSMHAPFTRFTRDEVKAVLPYLEAFANRGTLELHTFLPLQKLMMEWARLISNYTPYASGWGKDVWDEWHERLNKQTEQALSGVDKTDDYVAQVQSLQQLVKSWIEPQEAGTFDLKIESCWQIKLTALLEKWREFGKSDWNWDDFCKLQDETSQLLGEGVEESNVIDREQLGQYVRIIEIELAYELSVEEPSSSEIMPYHDLPEADKERRRRIGEFMANVLHKNHHSLDSYQQEVQRTVGTKGYGDTLAMTAMGLAGETGECVELIKKHLWHSHELDKDKIRGEIGDVLWYISAMCNALNISLKDVIDKNVEKLRARYPSGFSAERSKNREDEEDA